jgi:hypothetical protein
MSTPSAKWEQGNTMLESHPMPTHKFLKCSSDFKGGLHKGWLLVALPAEIKIICLLAQQLEKHMR